MPAERTGRRQNALVPAEPPELPAQLENLFYLVWQCEKEWRLDDRIDFALRRDEAAARAARMRRPG